MSSLLMVKLGRDLRASSSRFVLMVIAIAVSLTAFGGVLFAWAGSGRETSRAYMSTEPASATILLDKPIDADQMAAIAAQALRRPGVIAATGRTQFTSESVQVNGQPRDIPLQVFVAAPDDPMRIAKFFPRQRSWPPAPGEIFIARDSLDLLGVTVDDTVTVKLPAGQALRLRVADTVYDPSLSPSPQEQTGRAYLSTAALASHGEKIVLDQLKLQNRHRRGRLPRRLQLPGGGDPDACAHGGPRRGAWQPILLRAVASPDLDSRHPHLAAVVLLGAVLATEAAGSRASRLTVREALAYL